MQRIILEIPDFFVRYWKIYVRMDVAVLNIIFWKFQLFIVISLNMINKVHYVLLNFFNIFQHNWKVFLNMVYLSVFLLWKYTRSAMQFLYVEKAYNKMSGIEHGMCINYSPFIEHTKYFPYIICGGVNFLCVSFCLCCDGSNIMKLISVIVMDYNMLSNKYGISSTYNYLYRYSK